MIKVLLIDDEKMALEYLENIISWEMYGFELAAYGIIVGFLYNHSRWKCIVSLYRSLIIAMLGGRIVWGAVRIVMTGVAGEAFTWQMFMAGAFLNAIPGIILQLVLIPTLMLALDRTGVVHFRREGKQVA